ncbi:MAG: hypothetical protein KBF97_07085, partial [Bacteroidetes bacterium]|nr:hypothetical protein [Bacteroidota bacterium]
MAKQIFFCYIDILLKNLEQLSFSSTIFQFQGGTRMPPTESNNGAALPDKNIGAGSWLERGEA